MAVNTTGNITVVFRTGVDGRMERCGDEPHESWDRNDNRTHGPLVRETIKGGRRAKFREAVPHLSPRLFSWAGKIPRTQVAGIQRSHLVTHFSSIFTKLDCLD